MFLYKTLKALRGLAGNEDLKPRKVLTGVLLSTVEGCGAGVAAVFDGDVGAAFDELYDITSAASWSGGYEKARAREAVHFRLTKGETLTRECTVKVTP